MAGFAKQPVSLAFDEEAFHILVPALESEKRVHNWVDVVNVTLGVADGLKTGRAFVCVARHSGCFLASILRSPSSRGSPECRYNERTEFSFGPSSIASCHHITSISPVGAPDYLLAQPKQAGVDVLAVDALSVGVVVGRIACPYAGLAPRCPIAAGALAQAAMETEVADVKLLLLRL